MPYIEERCVAGKTVEIRRYHTYRYNCKGCPRAKNAKETTEQQKVNNQRLAEMVLRRILNNNFRDGDYLVTLDFRKASAPKDSTEMQNICAKLIRSLRKEYQKAGIEMKYVYVKEVGPRGGRHIHMVITESSLQILNKVWKKYGGVNVQPLNTDGQYAKIAEYFIKYAMRTEDTEGALIGKRWYGSRNLEKPVVHKRIIRNRDTFRKIAPVQQKGWYVEKESVQSGINSLGYEYLSYTLHAIEDNRRGG